MNSMKNIITCLIIFLSTLSTQKDNCIIISHIGISDKPIFDIIMHDSEVKESWFPFNCYVRKEDYDSVKEIIMSFTEYSTKPTTSFGSFKVTINEGSKKSEHYLNRQNAIHFFHVLLDYLNKQPENEDLKIELRTNLKRISF